MLYCHRMKNLDQLAKLGLFDARVPRYTSYPTAPIFSQSVGQDFQTDALSNLDPNIPVSIYAHIPFCERLCWFCACRTQGTLSASPVESYIETLKEELELVAKLIPSGLRMGRLHWGGGTPTILPPYLIHQLSHAIKEVIPPAEQFEFSVEIDPTLVDDAKIEALAQEGMNRASIGIQDFLPKVQKAIGREQSFEVTAKCVTSLRRAGIKSLNTDLVYGLPYQTPDTITASIEKTLQLEPNRVALFGYAHVPHMAKRQKLIKEDTLPNDKERYHLAELAAKLFQKAGFESIGIDHFAKPGDELAQAKHDKTLRRNFQGYTTDTCPTLIGLGASSISRFEGGYVQNASATAAYTQRIKNKHLPGHRGHQLSVADRFHARVIEMLMCDFQLDNQALSEEFGPLVDTLHPIEAEVAAAFPGFVRRSHGGLKIEPSGRALTRLIARYFDQYADHAAQFSKAS